MKNKQMSGGELMVSLAVLAVGMFLGAFTTVYLWNNIVSQILGITTITMIQALALDWFWAYFSNQFAVGDIKELLNKDKDIVTKQLDSITRTLMILGIGWLIIQFL